MEIFKTLSHYNSDSVATNLKHNPPRHTTSQINFRQSLSKNNSLDDSDKNGSRKSDNYRMSEILNRLNDNMKDLHTNIRFGFNDKIDSLYVSIVEADSGRLIRKIPTEEIMKLTEHFKEIVGMIFDKKE